MGGFALHTGMRVFVRFTDTTSTANPPTGNITLNINNTGAKQIKIAQNNTMINQGYGWMFCSNRAWELVYDGTYWNIVNYDTNTWQGNGIKTYAKQTGSGTTVTNTIANNVTMDNAIKTLLNNDVALNTLKQPKQMTQGVALENISYTDVEALLRALATRINNINAGTYKPEVVYWNHQPQDILYWNKINV
jgi:hypothetical protein